MSESSELSDFFEGAAKELLVKEYLRALDKVHADFRGRIQAYLASPNSNGSTQQKELPLESGGSMTELIERTIRGFAKAEFTWADVRDVLRDSGITTLTDAQIGSAFRKLKQRKRPPSPIVEVAPSRGHLPGIYRLKQNIH